MILRLVCILGLASSGCALVNAFGDGNDASVDARPPADAFLARDAPVADAHGLGADLCVQNTCYDLQTQFMPSAGPQVVAVAQLAGGPELDIAVANNSLTVANIFESGGQSLPVFSENGIVAAGSLGNITAMVHGHFDGDNLLDLAIADDQSNLRIVYADGSTRTDRTPTLLVAALAVGQLGDGDAIDDIVMQFQNGSYGVLMSADSFVENKAYRFSPTGGGKAMALGRFDQGDTLDLAVLRTDNKLDIFAGEMTGAFGSTLATAVMLVPTIAIAAVNLSAGDGPQDLVAITDCGFGCDAGAVTAHFYTANGELLGTYTHPRNLNPYYVVAGDFNTNGERDVVIAGAGDGGGGGEVVMLFDGTDFSTTSNGSFRDTYSLSVGDSAGPVVAQDLNDDGKADFVIARQNDSAIHVFVSQPAQ